MRPWLARLLACLCTAAALSTTFAALPPTPAGATGGDGGTGDTGNTGTGGALVDRDFTLLLRDLFVAQGRLTFFARARAQILLARPTDGPRDPGGDGYRGRARRTCSEHVCVHHVGRGPDAPPDAAWVRRTSRVMEAVWRREVGRLGFAAPPADGRRGGDARFDVYLADLGARGLFGYCTPERKVPGQRASASGYCVLDNDFAREQYETSPVRALRVTAAHEFFHAIQFGYNYMADPWLMETTAVWVEERFADRANDSRRYLRFGNVRRPWVPLDTYSNTGYAQYGNWPFWERLSSRFGPDVVRAVWRRVDSNAAQRGRSSVAALRDVLQRRTGDKGALRDVLTGYAAAGLDPARSYREGADWPSARISRRRDVPRGGVARSTRVRVDHLAAKHVALRPPRGRRTAKWRLQLSLELPRRSAAVLTVRRDNGRISRRTITDRSARVRVAFGPRVVEVVVTAVNASTRYRCRRGTLMACGGVPKDDGASFTIGYRVRSAR